MTVRNTFAKLPDEVPTLSTDRLTLRQIGESDSDALTPIIQLPEVSAVLGHEHPLTAEQTLAFVRGLPQQATLGLRFAFAVIHSDSARVMGVVQLHPINPVNRDADLAIWLSTEARGQRYGTEAARAVIDWATQTLRLDINGVTTADNVAAIALMRALNMEDLGQQIVRSRRFGNVSACVFIARRLG
jgi:ribosomal-protein-alanine N-acetyltransferase